jgi:predicted DNA binding CopG/RHH family protein
MRKKLSIPKFKSEAEEAQWWYNHRDQTAKTIVEAVEKGRTTTLSAILHEARQRSGPTPTVSIRIDPDDLSRARLFASRKGLRYQTYLKMLLHEALLKEENR